MIYAADFETTSYHDYLEDGFTRVYLWAMQNLYTNEIYQGNNISEFFNRMTLLESGDVIFFHNLKFDGKFLVDYMLRHKIPFTSLITDRNEWFNLNINNKITIKDSLKKFPGMSIANLAKTFNIAGKESLEISKRRDPSYIAGEDEIKRVLGDVRILAYALRSIYDNGSSEDTASADAFRYFQKTLEKEKEMQYFAFRRLFPRYYSGKHAQQQNQRLDTLFRKGYYGGWCYLNPKFQGKLLRNVSVIDRNSMYPAVMMSEKFPFGHPLSRAPEKGDVYIVDLEARFRLRKNHLPFIQSKTNIYTQNDMIEESEDYLPLVLTSPLYELFHKNYIIDDEIINHVYGFQAKKGIFNKHINHFYKIKKNATNPGERLMAKLQLNSLYGKFGQNPLRCQRTPLLEDDHVRYTPGEEKYTDTMTYLPVAMFVTAYARVHIVKLAEKFKSNFVYADTDSIHFLGDLPKNVDIGNELGQWKLESQNDLARYIRTKVYIHGDADKNVTEVKAAGAPPMCRKEMNFDTLKTGSQFDGKLIMKTVPGGCVLYETTYSL